jgi:hypothetical protein
MRGIIRRLPFYEHATTVSVGGEPVVIRAHQIAIWVCLRDRSTLSPPFPTVLDIGYSHYFSIREELLERWAGIRLEGLRPIGRCKINERNVDLFAAGLLLQRNKPGTRDAWRGVPQRLMIPDGIAVYRVGDSLAPRLPTLGLRTIVHNGLVAVIDGKRRRVTIGQPWF